MRQIQAFIESRTDIFALHAVNQHCSPEVGRPHGDKAIAMVPLVRCVDPLEAVHDIARPLINKDCPCGVGQVVEIHSSGVGECDHVGGELRGRVLDNALLSARPRESERMIGIPRLTQ